LITTVAVLVGSVVANADVVLDWNKIMVETVSGQNPFAQARFAGITQLAVFEAVNVVTGHYTPYLGTISAPAGSSAEAAAIAAAHTVLKNYFPVAAAALDTARANSLASIPDGPSKVNGIAVGEAAAAAMIAARMNDGAAPPEFYLPVSSDPGQWQLTPSCPAAGGILLQWRNVTPFAVRNSSQFRSDPPPALASIRYAKSYNEVKLVGDVNSTARPPHLSDVATFYSLVSAVVAWNSAANQLAVEEGTSLSENARTLALLNMAMSDALVTVMETKYHYTRWRPETAIREGDLDGNPRTDPDSTYKPFIVTPCFPSYPSAHASASYSAREILARIFGNSHHLITLSTPAMPGVVLQYHTLSEITDDIDNARVYGGIHFRYDQDEGGVQGTDIGRYVYRQRLRCLKGCNSDEAVN
jgi:membrane-associated phospholipid phosphatase